MRRDEGPSTNRPKGWPKCLKKERKKERKKGRTESTYYYYYYYYCNRKWLMCLKRKEKLLFRLVSASKIIAKEAFFSFPFSFFQGCQGNNRAKLQGPIPFTLYPFFPFLTL